MDDQQQNEDRMRRALQTIKKLQQRLEIAERNEQKSIDEPIAVIGMSCRFPGGCNSPEAFWQLLDRGGDAITQVPADRWDAKSYYHPQPATPGKIITTDGGFLDSVREFDAHFFGIAPKEAASLDPQQRMLLEVSWEAMERAGVVPAQWNGQKIGVFVGISAHDYSRHLMARPLHEIDAYLATGNSHSVAAGRLSYTFGFTGPSLGVDTACSSSLVALHAACQGLHSGECRAALVGGVNCILSPELSMTFSQARMLSPDGRCKTFAADANGFVRSEGCGVVVLKRLSEAQAAGDTILAVVRGSAINQDGRSGGLTVPHGPSQQAVIEAALTQADVRHSQIHYLEAHGTGTQLGDPIELGALAAVFGESHSQLHPLHVGSVKTNLGHMEAAAGIGGLMKVILAMQQRRLPRHLHFDEPTPHVPWAEMPLQVTAKSSEWQIQQGQCAGVSSFGFSGTNACVIVESPQAYQPAKKTILASRQMDAALLLSANSEMALRQMAGQYASLLEAGANWQDVCWTAFECRTRFRHRRAVLANSSHKAIASLRAEQFWQPDEQTTISANVVDCARKFLADEPCQWPGEPGQRVEVPTYPFQRKKHWVDVDSSQPPTVVKTEAHPMLGAEIALAQSEKKYFQANSKLFMDALWQGHRVFDRPVLPAVGFVEMMVAACHNSGLSQLSNPKLNVPQLQANSPVLTLADISFATPLYLDAAASVQVTINEQNESNELIVARQTSGNQWGTHSKARFSSSAENQNSTYQPLQQENKIRPADVYQRLAEQSVTYGPDWRLLHSISVQDNQIDAEIRLPERLDNAFFFPPIVLDASVQSLAALFVDQQRGETFLPEGIGRVDFYTDRLRGETFTSRALVTSGSDWLSANILLFDGQGTLQVAMTDFRLRPIRLSADAHPQTPSVKPPAQQNAAQENIENWFYTINWLPEELPPPTASPAEIVADIQPSFLEQLAQPASKDYLQRLPKLDKLATHYAQRVLSQVGEQAVVDEHRQLFQRLVEIQSDSAASELTLQLEQELSSTFMRELKLLGRCAENMPAILAGEQNSLEVLFPQGSSDELAWLYEKSVGARLLNEQVRASVERVVFSSSKPLRVLEIGAGTGGTTAALLPLLEKVAPHKVIQYTVTDISPLLVDHAQQRFGSQPGMTFQTFDVERGLAEQGIEPGSYDLVIAANVLHATTDLQRTLKNVSDTLQPTGQLVLLEGTRPLLWLDLVFGLTKGWWLFDDDLRTGHPLLSTSQWKSALDAAGFSAAALGSDTLPQTVILAQKVGIQESASKRQATNEDTLFFAEDSTLEELLQLVQQLIATDVPRTKLTVVTRGAIGPNCHAPEQAAAWGFARTVELEHPELHCYRIDLDPLLTLKDQKAVLNQELTSQSTGAVMYRDGKRYVARLDRAATTPRLKDRPKESFSLAIDRSINQLTYASAERRPPDTGEVEIQIEAAGINFIDVLDVAGLLPFERDWLGVECAGTIVAVGVGVDGLAVGDRVVALAPGTMRTHLTVPAKLVVCWDRLVKDPAVTTVADAATIPACFFTAELALRNVAKLQAGERVLIHSAAGGTGMAAVRVAQQLGAKIFATASRGKWQVLRGMGVHDIMDSRSLDFAEQVMQATGGAGVDVVLNALTGEYVSKGLESLAPGGRFIELGKRDIWTKEDVAKIRPDVQYHVVDLMSHTEAAFAKESTTSESIFAQADVHASLPKMVFPVEEALRGFETMRRAKHIGKVVLSFADSRLPIYEDASYLITGGLGGLGLATALWFIEHGAKHVVLLGRSIETSWSKEIKLPQPLAELHKTGKIKIRLQEDPATSGELKAEANSSAKVTLDLLPCNVDNREQLANAIEHANSIAPLRGVIHAAGVLSDATIRELTWQRMLTVLRPKMTGALHLHELTQGFPLDFFVLYSSAASLFGSPGQASHVAANSYLDALAHHRRSLGLPAQSINWGPWSEIGSAAKKATEQMMAERGIGMITPERGLQSLEQLLQRPDLTQVGVLPVYWSKLQQVGAGKDPFFSSLIDTNHKAPTSVPNNTDTPSDWFSKLRALPRGQRQGFLTRQIQTELSVVLGYPTSELPAPDTGFFDLGLDSLMAVDLKNRLARHLEIEVSPTLLFQNPNITSLAARLVELLADHPTAEKSVAEKPVVESPVGGPAQCELVGPTPNRSSNRTAPKKLDEQIASELTALDDLLG